MLRQLNNLSKFTTSSLKYAANNTAAALVSLSASTRDDPTLPSPHVIAYWITETQRGLDAFFNDEFELAQTIFMQHHLESPFHAVGFALIAYVEAMLGFESDKIQTALERIAAAEVLARQFSKKARRRSWHHHQHRYTRYTSTEESAWTSPSSSDTTKRKSKPLSPEIQYELLATNCMLMSSTIQFLRNSWLEYMKAAYKLRKAYKLYEQMFESLTGQKASEYASHLKKKGSSSKKASSSPNFATTTPSTTTESLSSMLANSAQVRASWNEKRLSLFHMSRKPSFDVSCKKRPMSTLDCFIEDSSFTAIDNAIESGIFFGIGLFSLIFSLLPPRVNKILNTLGFHSSRPFALHLLTRSFNNQGLYSSLSALSLLAYYTNLSLFIHPQLLPNSLSLENARHILDQMKLSFPHGKIWKLLEGKLCKMEGKTRRGVEILRDARRRENTRVDLGTIAATLPPKKKKTDVCELAQLQALAVYEMGWGQIFLGDYFQAAETFFRLESMNNWSRAFYHYIATCCMFADEEYDKSALEFMQIPSILKRKRHLGGRLLPNEIFAERKIKHWKAKANNATVLDGPTLKRVVVVHPLWELIYLWNGFSQLTVSTLQLLKQTIETSLATLSKEDIGSDMSQLYLLLGVSVRELGDFDLADMYLRQSIRSEDIQCEDRWVIPHGLYEMAALCCFRIMQTKDVYQQMKLYKEAHEWIRKSEKHLAHRVNHLQQQQQQYPHSQETESVTSDNTGDSDWDSRLHVRCQLLIEKLEDFSL
ncbi:hypothetical protein HMPREF1544_12293 [Mucor circinelloides 1006PhL]|uniref:Mitochondrial outer membrane protein IML2 n=1 Tax=Mucor circinelloides f. circinelloides (strain 1006PhL) TaxID=1220926 RepID=S2JMM0_MUCC1|nr:hypothetical protein HMPREF1544_12293 [Mucor circinelloides 1006PhL]